MRMDNIRPQRDKNEVFDEKKVAARLLAVEKTNRGIRAVTEQITKDVSTTMKAAEEIGALTTSLKLTVEEVGELEIEREAVTRKLGKPREGKERVEYELAGLQAKL